MDQETKLKRRASVKQKGKKESQTVAQTVAERKIEEVEELAQKISEVSFESEEEEEEPEKPKVEEKRPKVEEKKPKKKPVPVPKIEPLMPSAESPEEMVSITIVKGHLHITSYVHLTVILKLKRALTKEAKYKVIIPLLTIKCPWIKIDLEKVVTIF